MIPQYIILHCSATKDSGTASWEAIRDYHTEVLGWSDIGYHFGIEEFEDELVLLKGRSPWTMGAHCRAAGRNSDSLGLCVVGDYETEAPSPEKYNTVVAVLTSMCFMFSIPPENVYGHREFEEHKTCPGVMWDLDKLREDIKEQFNTFQGLGTYLEI